MIERTVIHVGGPPGAGKTAFVEAFLRATDDAAAVGRCVRDDSVDDITESSSRNDEEMSRYRAAGAVAVARIAVPPAEDAAEPMPHTAFALPSFPYADAFYDSALMSELTDVVIIEGDDPLGYADLRVFVAPPLPIGASLFEEKIVDGAAEDRARADRWADLFSRPDGLVQVDGRGSR